jgi:hypothetical protein
MTNKEIEAKLKEVIEKRKLLETDIKGSFIDSSKTIGSSILMQTLTIQLIHNILNTKAEIKYNYPGMGFKTNKTIEQIERILEELNINFYSKYNNIEFYGEIQASFYLNRTNKRIETELGLREYENAILCLKNERI